MELFEHLEIVIEYDGDAADACGVTAEDMERRYRHVLAASDYTAEDFQIDLMVWWLVDCVGDDPQKLPTPIAERFRRFDALAAKADQAALGDIRGRACPSLKSCSRPYQEAAGRLFAEAGATTGSNDGDPAPDACRSRSLSG